MSGSLVVCRDCGDSSSVVEWGFVLLARHGWTADLEDSSNDAEWRCGACNERLAASGVWDLTRHAESPRRPLRVLLVDDHRLVLRATCNMLRELDVVTAGSAADALAQLAAGAHFDVIVSYVSMPQMNGLEFYVRVRERYPHLAERFLLLSGDSYGASLLSAVVARRENLATMPKILEKPVPRDALVREVTALSTRRVSRSGTYSLDLTLDPRAKAK
jgi:CheY-like chemotaxis protein